MESLVLGEQSTRNVVRVSFGALVFGAVYWLSIPLQPVHGLIGRYFPNPASGGPPLAQTLDVEINTDTLIDGPAGKLSAYSVEWTGALLIEESGRYQFTLYADDGAELDLTGATIVRSDVAAATRETGARAVLETGIYPVALRYRQNGGALALRLRFARDGHDPTDIPARLWLTRPMPLAEYRVRRAIPAFLGAVGVGLWLAVRQWRRIARGPGANLRNQLPCTESRHQARAAIPLLVAAGLATRLVMYHGTSPILWPDSDIFLETARGIFRGQWLEHDPFRTLLYPYYLYGVLRALDWTDPAGRVIIAGQYAMGVLASVAFYSAARRAFEWRIALAGALLFHLHAMQLFYESSILSETLFTLILSSTVLLAARLIERPGLAGASGVGFACAALTLTRPVGQWYLAALLPPILAACATVRQRVSVGLLVMATYAAFVIPWSFVNQREYGHFGVAIGTGLGVFTRVFEVDRSPIPALSGYDEVADSLRTARARNLPQANWVRDELRRTYRYSAAQVDDRMLGLAATAIADDPFRFVSGSARQWLIQSAGTFGIPICQSPNGPYLCSGRTEGYRIDGFPNTALRDQARVRRWLIPFFQRGQLPIAMIGALALFGAIAHFAAPRSRPERLTAAVLLATVVYFTMVPALTQWPQDRYRLPIDTLLFMFAAAGIAAVPAAADL